MSVKIRNQRLTDDQFFKIRHEEVLPQWETGKDIENLDECIEVAKELSLVEGKNFALSLKKAKAENKQVLIPQFGRALTDETLEGIQYVERQFHDGQAGSWTIYSDSYTRKNDYKSAAAGIERSKKEGMSMLNGWPVVNYGVEEARRIMRGVKLSLHFNSTDEDGRLASEIVMAAGWNAASTRTLQEVIAHCKHISLEEMIRINQYEARLAGIYTEKGVPICPYNACHLTGYDSAGYHSFVCVSEALIAAEQGVNFQYLTHGLGMNLIQDIAMINVTERLCKEYCSRFGYNDVEFFSGGFPFLGAWPPREEEANAMIAWNAAIPILGGCTGLILKCQDEAFATPTKEGMAKSVRLAQHMMTLMGSQRLQISPQIELEEKMIELEVRTLMEKCLEAGDGDIAVGICKGVDVGWIDTMLTPWKYNHGKVLVARDAQNAVRYIETGNIPLPDEVKEYHREKMAEREKIENRKAGLDMAVQDLQFASIIKRG
jgi:methylaspartate mutase epsilon subunit